MNKPSHYPLATQEDNYNWYQNYTTIIIATAITPAELIQPATEQIESGTNQPLSIFPDHEMPGVVEDVGPKVTDIKTGDALYGLTDFAFRKSVILRGST